MSNNKPLVVHLIYKLDVGGLEKVMLDCIQGTVHKGVEHAVIALTEATEFAQMLPENVQVFSLNKKPGSDLACHIRLFRILRKLKPAVIQTYNIATIEYHPIAWLAGVKGHIHAEHGRDIYDPKGENKKHNLLRRLMVFFIHSYIAVSDDLTQWLINYVGLSKKKVKLIYNGIDTEKFAQKQELSRDILPFGKNTYLFGAISRLTPIKDHQNLIHAFAILNNKLYQKSNRTDDIKLVIVGDGPLATELRALVEELDLKDHVYFTGEQSEIEKILPELNVYVMSSIAEGIPLAILEAMSVGLPIVSTEVGGIPELLENNKQGLLVPAQDSEALANAMLWMLEHDVESLEQGKRNRDIVDSKFSLSAMVDSYLQEYKKLIG